MFWRERIVDQYWFISERQQLEQQPSGGRKHLFCHIQSAQRIGEQHVASSSGAKSIHLADEAIAGEPFLHSRIPIRNDMESLVWK